MVWYSLQGVGPEHKFAMCQLSFIIGGLQFQVRASFVPSPTPSFSSLAILQAMYIKQRKAGRGTGSSSQQVCST